MLNFRQKKWNRINGYKPKSKIRNKVLLKRIHTYLTDHANGMRYFPSLAQNCLLDFNTFCAHYRKETVNYLTNIVLPKRLSLKYFSLILPVTEGSGWTPQTCMMLLRN